MLLSEFKSGRGGFVGCGTRNNYETFFCKMIKFASQCAAVWRYVNSRSHANYLKVFSVVSERSAFPQPIGFWMFDRQHEGRDLSGERYCKSRSLGMQPCWSFDDDILWV